jgi:anti-sigma regulatory factor (Ser/Thr protein kinase)
MVSHTCSYPKTGYIPVIPSIFCRDGIEQRPSNGCRNGEVDGLSGVQMRTSLVSESNFLRASRDSGYKGLSTAIGELVDNSLQACAKKIEIYVREIRNADGKREISIGVLDDGLGMDLPTLQGALQFGGTLRFNDRGGLGRFGMGLPNSSMSQAPRVEVFSWRPGMSCLWTYLDVQEFVRRKRKHVPRVRAAELPNWASPFASESGVLVVWSQCDRLKFRKANTIADRLRPILGRMYFYALQEGLRLMVNGDEVTPVDPLFRSVPTIAGSATLFAEPLMYEVAVPGTEASSLVEVRFSELPVKEWAPLPNEVKRTLGIVGGAGVSVQRLGREIDHGWLLMGTKRKENYDDWWRCEIRFSPVLDEMFGVTHTKQGIRPSTDLKEFLEPELEAIARRLNTRVRTAFQRLKAERPSQAVAAAGRQDRLLPPIAIEGLRRPSSISGSNYRIEVRPIGTRELFTVSQERDTVVLVLNEHHPFYHRVYKRCCSQDGGERYGIECTLLAAARASLAITSAGNGTLDTEFRSLWGDALAAFLGS